MQFARDIPKVAYAAVCAVVCLVPVIAGGQQIAPSNPAERTEITLPEARQIATHALASRQPELAYQLAKGLLQADPKSSFAHFVLARAQGQLGQTNEARKSAARAYRFADTKLHKFEAAELAARLSYADNRPTLTQLWLRRAVQNAPDKKVEAQLGRDFGRVRAENPFSFSLRGGVRPSTNVNNGADTAVQTIDGSPIVGTLSGSAQALSGMIGHVDASMRYRLRGTKRSRTDISARLYVQRVALSSGARRLATTTSNGDFGSTFAEVSANHTFAIGDSGNSGDLDVAIGQYWSGGDPYYSFARLEAGRNWRLGDRTRFSLRGTFEVRNSDQSSFFDSTVTGLSAGVQHKLEGGDQINLSLSLRQTDSDFSNARNLSTTLAANYSFADQIGPAKVSAGVVLGLADYADFRALFHPSVGREDKSVYADVNFFFPDVDYAGFAPTVRVRAGRKYSNISRYDTRELSVSLGIQSKF
ncbi:MAG: tetratricopeptide repeat protein [Sulfitobacter sp.]